ncbi:patatin-like phospholipase family protein [Ferrimonas lipolytica]|uniref:Patatin family protein n=1 Tax=Ferrimonas lipolytica TaxID=2724191 RepID=A0A6H1UIW4_9GAMM|nr:patatin family protein [Ferrimonas lipolytica]QIZ78569.1 patatin family protein [Ferrimonas lipolytica]
MDQQQTALVVEGGALRAVFSCGVLDGFMDANFKPFDSLWGVSAGATNVAAYQAQMRGRNQKIYTDLAQRPQFMQPLALLRGGDVMDLDWLWQVSMAELGFDNDTFAQQPQPVFVAVTHRDQGTPHYLRANTSNIVELIKASSALPLLYRAGVELEGERYVDGGVADSIPVQAAIAHGATKIMVLRSRSANYRKPAPNAPRLLKRLLRNTPGLIEPMLSRAQHYNFSVELIRNPPAGIEIIEICPPKSFQPSRFSRQTKLMEQGYQLGLDAAASAMQRWQTNAK